MAYPSYSASPPTNPLLQQFSIPTDDIDYDFIKTYIRAYLGDEAEVHRDRQSDAYGRSIKIYKITTYDSLTNEHIDLLKAESARWKSEKRRSRKEAVRPSKSRSHTHRRNRTRHTVDTEDMYVGVDEAPDETTHSYGSRPDEDSHALYSAPLSPAAHDSSNNWFISRLLSRFLSRSQSGQNHEIYHGHETEADNEAGDNYHGHKAENDEQIGDNYQVYPDATPDYSHANSTQPADSTLHGHQHDYGSSAPSTNLDLLGYLHGYANSTQISDPNPHEYEYHYANAIQPTSANPHAYQHIYYQSEEMSADQVSNHLPSIQDENAVYAVANRPIEAEQDDEDYRRRLARNRRRLNHNQDRFNRPVYA